MPAHFTRYYEPFLGGAALFFALQPEKAVLSDTNAELIECYSIVRDEPEALIRHLRQFANTKSEYMRVRASKPRTPVGRAARFMYLATLSFNGIYRVNLKGEFNVPYGGKKHLDVVREEDIRTASHALQGRRLACMDFERALQTAQPGDFVYLDPPYTVAHENNGFLKYNAKVFSWEDQRRLARTAQSLVDRGCHVVVTNACHSSILELFRGLRPIVVHRQSRIAADPRYRRTVNELILTNVPSRQQ